MRIDAMTRGRTRFAGVLLVLLAAGCSAGGGMKTPIAINTLSPLPVLSANEATQFTGVAWELEHSQPDSTLITVRSTTGGCRDLAGATVTSTADSFTVGVYASDAADCGGPAKVTAIVAVRLPSPLGSKRLTHAPLQTPGTR
jgi:hypothetical protein